MRRTAAAIGALAIAATMVAGCGSSGSSAAKDDVTTTSTSEAPTTTTKAPTGGPTEAELTAMLLTPAEMGTGWTVAPSSSDDSGSTPSCIADLRTKGLINDPRVSTQFAFDNGAAYAFEGLTWAGEDPAATLAAITTELNECSELTLPSNGQEVPATMAPATLPTMGEQSAAWTISFTADGQPVTADLVFAVQGDILIFGMDGLAVGAVTPDGTTEFVNGAATKVAQAAATPTA